MQVACLHLTLEHDFTQISDIEGLLTNGQLCGFIRYCITYKEAVR